MVDLVVVVFVFCCICCSVAGQGTITPPPVTTPGNATANPTSAAPNTTVEPNATTPSPTEEERLGEEPQEAMWAIPIALLIGFPLAAASCYVMMMWQQRALRQYRGIFENDVKQHSIHQKTISEKVAKWEEDRVKRRAQAIEAESDDEEEKKKGEKEARRQEVIARNAQIQQEQQQSSEAIFQEEIPIVEALRNSREEEWRRALAGEPADTTRFVLRQGPLMPTLTSAVKPPKRKPTVLDDFVEEEDGEDSLKSSLKQSLKVFQNVEKLKKSSQLRHIEALL